MDSNKIMDDCYLCGSKDCYVVEFETKSTIQSVSWDSLVSIVSDCGLHDQCLIPSRGKEFFFYLLHPDWLWGQPSLLFNGYLGFFTQE